jgi:phage tail-like protein
MTQPLTTFRFAVVLVLDKPTLGLESPLCDAAFAECDGLDMTMQHKTVESGGVNDRQQHLIGPVTYSQVTLKRGMTSNLQLWNWFAQGTVPGSVLTAQGQITLWDPAGKPAIQFTLTGCLPVRMRAPSFNAQNGLVAVEEFSMVYERLTVSMPGAAGGLGTSTGTSASAGLPAGASLPANGGM